MFNSDCYPSDFPLALLPALVLSVSPGIASNATITAHLIPSVRILLTLRTIAKCMTNAA